MISKLLRATWQMSCAYFADLKCHYHTEGTYPCNVRWSTLLGTVESEWYGPLHSSLYLPSGRFLNHNRGTTPLASFTALLHIVEICLVLY